MTMESEEALLGYLRRWKCSNDECGHEHVGPPSAGSPWRWCPECKSSSYRTHDVVAVAGSDGELSEHAIVRKRPTRGMLAAMALQFDHGMFVPSLEVLGEKIGGRTPVQIAATLTTMLRLYAEAVGLGVYKPQHEATYRELLDQALRESIDEAHIA